MIKDVDIVLQRDTLFTLKGNMNEDSKTESIAFRTYPAVKRKLEGIAVDLDRSVSWVINMHLKQILSDQENMEIDSEEQKK